LPDGGGGAGWRGAGSPTMAAAARRGPPAMSRHAGRVEGGGRRARVSIWWATWAVN
jgi:hypothetical protein